MTRRAKANPAQLRITRLVAAFVLVAGLAAFGVFAMARPALAAESRQGWWLQIKGAACVQGPKVLLGDIALPQGELSAAAWKDMAARPLWDAPARPGHQVAFSRERLLAMLRTHAEDMAGACALPAQLIVQRGGKVVDGASLQQRIVEYLTTQGHGFTGEIEVKDLNVPEHVFLPTERDRLDMVATSPLKPGRINLLIEVKSGDGKVLRRYAASGFVNVWRALPCLIRPVNRLGLLSLDNVQFKRKSAAFNEDAWDGTGGPWRMVRSVGVDQVIRMSDLEPVPVIAKGEKVTLVYNGTNLHLQVKVEALADGGVGQSIQVRNLQSNRKIMATVQDSSTVVVR